MTQTFEREERFIVIKRKHLSAVQENEIRCYLHAQSIPTIESVVVESDWPIYEETWENVQRLAEGEPFITKERDELKAHSERLHKCISLAHPNAEVLHETPATCLATRYDNTKLEALDELIDSLTEVGGEITINGIQGYRDALARGE